MNKNKLLKTLGVGFATTLILAGCDTSDTSSDNNDTPDPVSESGENAEESPKVTFVSWLSEQQEGDQAVLDAYLEINPDANIEFQYVGDNQTANYYQQVDLMLLGEEDIDIVMTGSYDDFSQRAVSGAYTSLNEYFDNEGVDPYDEYIDTLIAPVNDEIYGIPGDVKSWIVFINQDKLEEAGLEVPPLDWTWDDFTEYSEALTDDDTYGAYFHTWGHFNYLNTWSLRLGNALISDDGSLAFDTDEFRDFVEYRKQMEEDGNLLPYQTIIASNATYRDRFFNEEVAMLPMGSFLIPELDDISSFPHEFTTTFAMMPRDPEAPEGRAYTESLYYSVANSSDAPEEAYDFLRFYTTEGARIKGVNLPAKADEDKYEYIEMMIDDEEYFDLDALESVFRNPSWEDNPNTQAPSYQRELLDMMIEETGKYYLGEEDIDTVIDNMMQRGQEIVDRNS